MTPVEFATRRAELGLTMAALAELLGVAPNTVWRWEAGQRAISNQVVKALDNLPQSVPKTA